MGTISNYLLKNYNLENHIMKIYIIIPFIIFFFFSFFVSSNNLNQLSESFFPMQIGSKWNYGSYDVKHPFDSTKIDEVWEIKSKKQFKNKTFYLIEKKFYNSEKVINKIDSIYYCLSNDSLLTLNNFETIENSSLTVIAIFSKTEYRIDTQFDYYMVNLIKKTDSTITFNYYKPKTRDSGYWKTFKKDVGIIDEHSAWG